MGIVVGLETSKDVWKYLENTFAQDSQEREFNLIQELSTIQKGTDSMNEYLQKFKVICDNSLQLGNPF